MIKTPSNDNQEQIKEKITFRSKFQQWNAEVQQQMRRRRLSQQNNSRSESQEGKYDNSVSQWWQWQGTGEAGHGVHKPDLNMTVDIATLSTPLSSKCRKSIIRTSSLKEQQKQISSDAANLEQTTPLENGESEEGLHDDVFVRADPINRGQKMNVKNAIISSTVTGTVVTNPYCTTARAPKTSNSAAAKRALKSSSNPSSNQQKFRNVHIRSASPSNQNSETVRVTEKISHLQLNQSQNNQHLYRHAAISNSPQSSSSGIFANHDQDSGYDGYCPEKSITSLGSSLNACSSENASLMSSASSNASHSSNEEAQYGNSHGGVSISPTKRGVGFATTAAIYGRISRQANCRPTSVYEKQYNGPVQHSLLLSSDQVPIVQPTSSSPNSSSCNSTPPPIPPLPPSLSIPKVLNIKRSQQIDGLAQANPRLLVRNSVPNHSPNKDTCSITNRGNVPPPLPPRPSNLTPSSVFSPHKFHPAPQHNGFTSLSSKYDSNNSKHSTTSLPRSRKTRKLNSSDSIQKRRESYHNGTSDSSFSQPLSITPIDLNRSYQVNLVEIEEGKIGKDFGVGFLSS